MVLGHGSRAVVVAAPYSSRLRIVTGEVGVRVFDLFAVDENLFITQFHGVAGNGNDPFDKVF